MKKRLFAFVLALCVAATLLPVSVMADGSTDDSLNGGDGGTTVTVECADSPTEKHDWSNGNGECKYCASKCTHDWDNDVCKICSMVCQHAETLDDCSCTLCGVYLHDWNTDGVCNNCGAPCDHAADWSGGCCNTCGKVCTHKEVTTDGASVSAWDNGICGVCGKVCTHETLSDDGASVSAWENGVCGVCGMTQPEPEPTPAPTPAPTPVPHSHYYTSRVTTAAGCVTPGVRTYFCSCGASYMESIPATGHDWDEGKVEMVSGDNSLRVDIACVCKNCGATQSMQHDSVEASLANRARDNQVTVVSDQPEAVEVKGTVLPNGGTAYVISEKVAADSAAAQSISIKSENEDIRYVGYRRTDEKGAATELLELNAAQGLASVDILRGELENGTPMVTVKENGRLIDLTNVSASLDDEQLSYSITTESGSEWSYSTGSTLRQALGTIKQITAYWESFPSRNVGDPNTGVNVSVEEGAAIAIGGGFAVSPIPLSEKDEGETQRNEQSEQPNYGDHGELAGSPIQIGGLRLQSAPDSETQSGRNNEPDNEVTAPNYGDHGELVGSPIQIGGTQNGNESDTASDSDVAVLQSETQSIIEELNSVRDGGFAYLETSNGGLIVPSAAEGEQTGEDTAPSVTPTPTPTPESTEDVWVTVSFETKTLYEDEPEEEEDDSPTIVRFVDTTPTPAPIQEYVTPTPSPTPVPTPTPIQWNFEKARCVCELCGEEYYYDEGHECETDPWEEFGETMEDGFEYVKESFEKEKCVPTGTLITLADGTQKPVEDVTESDLLLVYDHEAGTFTTASINFIERNDAALSTVVTLLFSDSSDTALVYEHGYFDLDEMRYVFLTAENAADYIGHRFYKAEIVDGVYTPVEVTLTAVTVTEEVVASYDFPTKYHLNFFADGLLSMPAETAGLTNFFAYDENLAYDAESMTAAIEQYGLLEYADLAAWLTEEEFVSYPAQYLAVNYGNGTLTQEELLKLIETYVQEYR